MTYVFQGKACALERTHVQYIGNATKLNLIEQSKDYVSYLVWAVWAARLAQLSLRASKVVHDRAHYN